MLKLTGHDLRAGQKLPWSAYDSSGKLLLRKGVVLESQLQLDALLKRGLYRMDSDSSEVNPLRPLEEGPTPLPLEQRTHQLREQLRVIYHYFSNKPDVSKRLGDRVRLLARQLSSFVSDDADAAIAAVHLYLQDDYRLDHPLHAAVFTELLGNSCSMPEAERIAIVCAALTHDIGILAFHEQLDRVSGPLNELQWALVKKHPIRGANLLQAHGVTDPFWLQAVRHHHERIDGSGYPAGLKDGELPAGARMLAIADVYSAMTRPRAYREARETRQTLQELFLDKGETIDHDLTRSLVRMLGAYPPGTLIRLKDGRIAMSVRRTEHAGKQLFYAVINANGGLLRTPAQIDAPRIADTLPLRRYQSVLSLVDQLYPPTLTKMH